MVSFTSGSRPVPVHGTGMTVLSAADAALAMTARKAASEIKGAAYSLGKAPEHLTENQKIRLNMIQAN